MHIQQRLLLEQESGMKCPPASKNLELNTKNRDATIKKYNYGPLNVDEPGDYWEKIAKKWDTTTVQRGILERNDYKSCSTRTCM